MLDNFTTFLKKKGKKEQTDKSKNAAKERLHLVLMQDRANVSADFLELMKQEIIEVIKKYIDVDENAIDVRLTNKSNDDGTTGAPVLYANIPIVSVKEEAKEEARKEKKQEEKSEENKSEIKEEKKNNKETAKDDEISSENKSTEEIIEKAEEIVEEIKEESKEE